MNLQIKTQVRMIKYHLKILFRLLRQSIAIRFKGGLHNHRMANVLFSRQHAVKTLQEDLDSII